MIGRGWLIVLLVTTVVQADDEGWGTLRGRFVFDGEPPRRAQLDVNKDMEVCGKQPLYDESLIVDEKTKGVRNVVVFLRSKPTRVHEEIEELRKKPAVMTQRACRYEPHVVLVMTGQEFLIHNDDAVGHNPNFVVPSERYSSSPLVPATGGSISHKFKRAQFVGISVTCNIHPWMKGHIFVRDNQYMAATSTDGLFEIKNLPTGELEFQAWHESWNRDTAPDSHPTWDRGRFKATINRDATTDFGTIRLGSRPLAK